MPPPSKRYLYVSFGVLLSTPRVAPDFWACVGGGGEDGIWGKTEPEICNRSCNAVGRVLDMSGGPAERTVLCAPHRVGESWRCGQPQHDTRYVSRRPSRSSKCRPSASRQHCGIHADGVRGQGAADLANAVQTLLAPRSSFVLVLRPEQRTAAKWDGDLMATTNCLHSFRYGISRLRRTATTFAFILLGI